MNRYDEHRRAHAVIEGILATLCFAIVMLGPVISRALS